MILKNMTHEKLNQSRRQAEELMTKPGFVGLSAIDENPLRLIRELQTFQIELEMQNEGLHRSQQELMEFKIRYTELFDFAPVGYVSLDVEGTIIDRIFVDDETGIHVKNCKNHTKTNGWRVSDGINERNKNRRLHDDV